MFYVLYLTLYTQPEVHFTQGSMVWNTLPEMQIDVKMFQILKHIGFRIRERQTLLC